MFTSGSGVDVAVGAGLGVDVGGSGFEVEHPLIRILLSKTITGIRFIHSLLYFGLYDYRSRELSIHPSCEGYFMVCRDYALFYSSDIKSF